MVEMGDLFVVEMGDLFVIDGGSICRIDGGSICHRDGGPLWVQILIKMGGIYLNKSDLPPLHN